MSITRNSLKWEQRHGYDPYGSKAKDTFLTLNRTRRPQLDFLLDTSVLIDVLRARKDRRSFLNGLSSSGHTPRNVRCQRC